jgi:hypothetical protein
MEMRVIAGVAGSRVRSVGLAGAGVVGSPGRRSDKPSRCSLRCRPFAPFPGSDVRPGARGLLSGEAKPRAAGGQHTPVDKAVRTVRRSRGVVVDENVHGCEIPGPRAYPAAATSKNTIHRLWTAECRRIPARVPLSSAVVRPGFAARLAAGRRTVARALPAGLLRVRLARLRLAGVRLARSWLARFWLARFWLARSWLARSWLARSWLARFWLARFRLARFWLAGVRLLAG